MAFDDPQQPGDRVLTGVPAAQASHGLAVHEAVLMMETDAERGLSTGEARQRLERVGPNALPRPRRRGPLLRFALQFHHPLIYVLLAAAAVTGALGEYVDAAVILGVAVVNAVVGFVQEARAERALEALTSMLTSTATVRRDGVARSIVAADVVPGDLVLLETGAKVPADLRLVRARELEIDESALTGESLAVRKATDALPVEQRVADRVNMTYSGTLVTRGEGAGVVVATGGDTELGLIHRLIGEVGEVATPLTRKLAGFSKLLTFAILALAAATYAIGVAHGEPADEVFMAAVALAVGAIPEGLPAALTITLAIGVARMARRHVIVRRLPAVETLGSTTVICTDKTGTLTENQMTVQVIWAGGEQLEVTGAGYRPEGTILQRGEPVAVGDAAALRACLVAGALCNDAALEERDGRWSAIGDPTEAALLVAARKGAIDRAALVAERPRLATVPFESARQFMATVHPGPDGGPAVVYVKGAVERVLAMASAALGRAGEAIALDRDAVLVEAERLAARGLRVLALAQGEGPRAGERPEAWEPQGLTFVGLQAMLDPPRPEAIAAVAECRSAGIEVKMVTGDHAGTAAAIARRMGIGGEEARVVTGARLAACDATELRRLVGRVAVFARVTPEQKLRLVEALQARGEIVAMTGDGVNDAPALKQADIGIAMGRGGTEVAKESGDVVLTDDNFVSIAAAVEEGRRIFDNITKFIVWTLPTNVGEGLLILVAIAVGATLPILPVQILWINMTTAVALGLTLAFERREPGIMRRPPRDPGRGLLTRDLLGRIVLVSALLLAGSFWLFEWELARGASDAEARTVAVNVFVLVEMLYLLNCRSLERSFLRLGAFSNPWVTGGVAVTIALQLMFTYATPMNDLFHSRPIGAGAWLRVGAVAVAAWAVVGLEKWLRARARAGSGVPSRGRCPAPPTR